MLCVAGQSGSRRPCSDLPGGFRPLLRRYPTRLTVRRIVLAPAWGGWCGQWVLTVLLTPPRSPRHPRRRHHGPRLLLLNHQFQLPCLSAVRGQPELGVPRTAGLAEAAGLRGEPTLPPTPQALPLQPGHLNPSLLAVLLYPSC